MFKFTFNNKLYPLLGWLCLLPGWSYNFAFTCIHFTCIIFKIYNCITVLPLPTPCPLPPLWYQSHSFLAGDSVVVFSVSPSVSTRNFGVQLSCPQMILQVLGIKGNLLFTCHYSPVTIHPSLFTGTIHCYCSLKNFAYLRGVVPYV